MRKVRAVILMAILLVFCISNSSVAVEMETTTTVKKVKFINSPQNIVNVKVKTIKPSYYWHSQEERQMAYKIAIAEAGLEDEMGQKLVINCAINNMKALGFTDLIQEFNEKGRYSSVIGGEVYILSGDRKILVTDEMITEEIMKSVDEAFLKDYSKELIEEAALNIGCDDPKYYEQGARFFYNPKAVSGEQASLRENITVKFSYGNHVYYSYWD